MYNMQNFGSGPAGSGMISGKWVHKTTGNIINVRDAILEGDDLIVMTDRGQISGEDFSRNYIQMSDEEYDMKGNIIGNASKNPTQQKQATQSMQPKMFDDPQPSTSVQPMMFDEPQEQPLYNPIPVTQPYTGQKEESESIKLIKKLFEKTESKPEVTVDIKWADFPKSELNMLINVFDVSKEDIANYMRTYLDDEEIKISIGKFIEKML